MINFLHNSNGGRDKNTKKLILSQEENLKNKTFQERKSERVDYDEDEYDLENQSEPLKKLKIEEKISFPPSQRQMLIEKTQTPIKNVQFSAVPFTYDSIIKEKDKILNRILEQFKNGRENIENNMKTIDKVVQFGDQNKVNNETTPNVKIEVKESIKENINKKRFGKINNITKTQEKKI